MEPSPSVSATPRQKREANRRKSARISTLGMSLVRPENSRKALAGRLQDISETGFALVLPVPYCVTDLLTIAPIGGRNAIQKRAEVIHVQNLDGSWLHGCRFIERLSVDEFQRLCLYHARVIPQPV